MANNAAAPYVPLPKLPGRLTADLILRAPQGMSALKEYEINLRGNKIPAVENLGVTENQFDSIDLSDNEIVKLEGFPPLTRLTTLMVHNNRIARIGPNLGAALPKVETLGLANNKLANLPDLDPLAQLPALLRLNLHGNPVTKKPDYRHYVIGRLPKLKLLDGSRVTDTERKEAQRLLAEQGEGANTFVPGEGVVVELEAPKKSGPTAEQLTAIRAAIQNADTMDEVQRLERLLAGGNLPSAFGGDSEMADS